MNKDLINALTALRNAPVAIEQEWKSALLKVLEAIAVEISNPMMVCTSNVVQAPDHDKEWKDFVHRWLDVTSPRTEDTGKIGIESQYINTGGGGI